MALDRRITIRIRAEGTRDGHGEYVPGAVTEYPVWAEQRGAGSADTVTPQGTEVTAVRAYTVRHFEALAEAPISRVDVVDHRGHVWNAENITLSDARRRFIDISALRAVV